MNNPAKNNKLANIINALSKNNKIPIPYIQKLIPKITVPNSIFFKN
jgi:hypothetical protein